MKDYYRILDISETADGAAIRRAFRSLALTCHPDITGDDGASVQTFLDIREAYETLVDEARRDAYDRQRLARNRQQMGPEFQESPPARPAPFSNRAQPTPPTAAPRRAPPTAQKPPPARAYSPRFTQERLRKPHEAILVDWNDERQPGNDDISGTLEVALEDSINETLYTINLAQDLRLPDLQRKFSVRLPGQLYEGARLCVPGLGYLKAEGGSGDLWMEIALARHPVFRLCGETLFYDITLRPWEAALGLTVRIPTLDKGFQQLGIPPVLTTPQMKRIENAGVYRRNGQRGDLWVNLRLEVAPPLSFRARRLWAELAEEYRRTESSANP